MAKSQSGDRLIEADIVIERLRHAIGEGDHGLAAVPGLLKRTLKEELWKDRIIKRTGERKPFESFAEFVTTPALEGLGADIRTIENLVRDDDEAKSLLDAALFRIQPRKTGTSAAHSLRALRNKRPDLHEEVIQGNLSPHGAMVKAGLRRPQATVFIDTPEAAIQGLLRRFSVSELEQALRDCQ